MKEGVLKWAGQSAWGPSVTRSRAGKRRKKLFEKKCSPRFISEKDQRVVIILTHICWAAPPPPPLDLKQGAEAAKQATMNESQREQHSATHLHLLGELNPTLLR